MQKKTSNKISEHAPKAKKPISEAELGYFLAGLIDGNGHISKQGYALIVFREKDLSVGYYLKKVLNHGNIRKVKNKRAYDFRCTNAQGLYKIEKLIFNKLKQPKRIKEFNSYLIPRIVCQPMKQNVNSLFKDHWLAGFIQAKGRFQIKILQPLVYSPRIVVKIDQKDSVLLRQIRETFGGSITYNKAQKTYDYNSVSFYNVVNYINYLDCHQVMGATLTTYWLWRKAFLIVQENKHNERAGAHKLVRLKKSLTILRN